MMYKHNITGSPTTRSNTVGTFNQTPRMQKLENEQPTFDGVASDLLMVLAVATYELPDSRGRYPVLEDEVED